MTILHLNLKRQWYEMIESGEKTEEYRELKDFWAKRLCAIHRDYMCRICYRNDGRCRTLFSPIAREFRPKYFSHVCFHYGYTKRTITFVIKEITIGKGNPKWGAPEKPVFIIKLGNRI